MNRLYMTILASCALLTATRLLASFFPHLRLWGLNQLHYFPLEFRIGLSAAALLILIPGISRPVASGLSRVVGWIAKRLEKTNRHLLYFGVGVLSLVPFWFLRSGTPLLGDGYLRAGEVGLGRVFSAAEPLDNLLHLWVSKFVGLDAYTTYAVLSCIAGGLFVFTVLHLCDLLGENGTEKLLMFAVILTMGANQLFFGYIETYTLMYAALAGYVLFAVRYLRQKAGFLWPCMFMILSVGLHFSAIFVSPSLVYLALVPKRSDAVRQLRRISLSRIGILVSAIALMAVGFYLSRIHSEGVGHLLIYPLGGGNADY